MKYYFLPFFIGWLSFLVGCTDLGNNSETKSMASSEEESFSLDEAISTDEAISPNLTAAIYGYLESFYSASNLEAELTILKTDLLDFPEMSFLEVSVIDQEGEAYNIYISISYLDEGNFELDLQERVIHKCSGSPCSACTLRVRSGPGVPGETSIVDCYCRLDGHCNHTVEVIEDISID